MDRLSGSFKHALNPKGGFYVTTDAVKNIPVEYLFSRDKRCPGLDEFIDFSIPNEVPKPSTEHPIHFKELLFFMRSGWWVWVVDGRLWVLGGWW